MTTCRKKVVPMTRCKPYSTIRTVPTHGRMSPARRAGILALAFVALAACSSTQSPAPPPSWSAESAEAPWRSGELPVSAVPQVYFTAWSRAENRETCALIAFVDTAATHDAAPRVAAFSGGWGVAYDRAETRSAFGVAGTGVKASDPSYDEWPHRLTWSDGSSAGYGPEGGTGPNQLAYLTIAGQECLYNVWSRLGRLHLEQLLATLRFVATPET